VKRRPKGWSAKDVRAYERFDAAVKLLHTLPAGYSVHVANTTMTLMRGPTHDEAFARPLHENVVAIASRAVRISGGDW
jgi:hypothetical protein